MNQGNLHNRSEGTCCYDSRVTPASPSRPYTPSNTLKIGLSHTTTIGESLTYGIGESLTPFEAVKAPFSRQRNFHSHGQRREAQEWVKKEEHTAPR